MGGGGGKPGEERAVKESKIPICPLVSCEIFLFFFLLSHLDGRRNVRKGCDDRWAVLRSSCPKEPTILSTSQRTW